MTFIRNLWYVAGWSNELADKPVARIVIGEPLVLWRTGDGTAIAIEDRCPHRHAPLSRGRLEGDSIRCMYHGLRFAADGSCREVPGTDAIPPNSTARTFPVVEKWSWLWVWMGDPAGADPALIPDAFGIDDPAWLMNAGAIDYAADYQLINDNLTDLGHLDFVHETSLRVASGFDWRNVPPKVTTQEDGLTLTRWFGSDHALPGMPFVGDTFNRYRYVLPGIFIMHTKIYPPGTAAACGYGETDEEPVMELVEQQAVTPTLPGRARYQFATGLGAKYGIPDDADERRAVADIAFLEDRTMIEAQQLIWDLTPPDRLKAFIPADKAPSIFRRLIARRLEEERRGSSPGATLAKPASTASLSTRSIRVST